MNLLLLMIYAIASGFGATIFIALLIPQSVLDCAEENGRFAEYSAIASSSIRPPFNAKGHASRACRIGWRGTLENVARGRRSRRSQRSQDSQHRF